MRSLIVGLALVCGQISVSSADELTGTLKRISERSQMNLGFREAEPPMSFRNKSGKPVGYSIDLCNHIVAAAKQKLNRPDIKVNYVPVTAGTRFAAIETGKIDILCGATTKTLGRSKRVGFTQLTFVTGASLLSLNDAKVMRIADLKGKQVAVTKNTTTIKALKGALKNKLIDAKVVPVATAAEGMAALDNRKVDAFASDQIVLIGQVIVRKNQQKYALSQELFSFEPFALAFQRGDADFQLVADSAISRLSRNREIVRLYGKWFGSVGLKPPPALQYLFRLNATPE